MPIRAWDIFSIVNWLTRRALHFAIWACDIDLSLQRRVFAFLRKQVKETEDLSIFLRCRSKNSIMDRGEKGPE
jgi:hypothetical protein